MSQENKVQTQKGRPLTSKVSAMPLLTAKFNPSPTHPPICPFIHHPSNSRILHCYTLATCLVYKIIVFAIEEAPGISCVVGSQGIMCILKEQAKQISYATNRKLWNTMRVTVQPIEPMKTLVRGEEGVENNFLNVYVFEISIYCLTFLFSLLAGLWNSSI